MRTGRPDSRAVHGWTINASRQTSKKMSKIHPLKHSIKNHDSFLKKYTKIYFL